MLAGDLVRRAEQNRRIAETSSSYICSLHLWHGRLMDARHLHNASCTLSHSRARSCAGAERSMHSNAWAKGCAAGRHSERRSCAESAQGLTRPRAGTAQHARQGNNQEALTGHIRLRNQANAGLRCLPSARLTGAHSCMLSGRARCPRHQARAASSDYAPVPSQPRQPAMIELDLDLPGTLP